MLGEICVICGNRHDRKTTKGNWKYYCDDCKDDRGVEIGSKRKRAGYILIWNGRKWQVEHRFIFEKHLGRKLLKGEIIHHRNGKRADNRLENLQLLTNKTHSSGIETKHSEDICYLLWRIEILEKELGIKQ